MATYKEISHNWQIALGLGEHVLYAQQLDGDGYDSDCPFDFYIADAGFTEIIAADVIDGVDYVFESGEDGIEIDWYGLIGYAREYELGGNVEASPFNWFYANFDDAEVLDPDDVSEALQDAGLM